MFQFDITILFNFIWVKYFYSKTQYNPFTLPLSIFCEIPLKRPKMNTAIAALLICKPNLLTQRNYPLASLLSSDSGLLPAPFAQRSTNSPKPPL